MEEKDVMVTQDGQEIPLAPENPIDDGIVVPDNEE